MDTKRIIEESTLPVACLTILSQTIGMSLIELGNSVPKKKLAFWKVSRHLAKSALDPVTVIQKSKFHSETVGDIQDIFTVKRSVNFRMTLVS